jgi:acyl-CoA thioesterase-1
VRRLNILSRVVLAGLAVTLAGCRADQEKAGSGVSEQASVTQPQPSAQASRPVIACFGDSLTAGYGADPGESYPDHLQKILDTDNYSYRVVNEGVSGNTTKDGLDRLARVIALHPQIVVLEFGGNDGLRGLPQEQTKQNIASMIDQLQTAHVKVALAGITLPPDYGPDYIAKFDAIYPALAKQYHVPLLPFLLKDVYGVKGDIQADGIHATEQGNKQVAANVAELIEPLLKH